MTIAIIGTGGIGSAIALLAPLKAAVGGYRAALLQVQLSRDAGC